MLYFSFVQSIIQYGITIWGGAYTSNILPLMRTQNIIIRVINKKHHQFSSRLLYKEYDVFNVRQLFAQKLIIFSHKYNYLWQNSTHSHNTRNHNTIHAPKTNKSLTQRHFVFLAPIMYNVSVNEVRKFPEIWKMNIKAKKIILEEKINEFWQYIE